MAAGLKPRVHPRCCSRQHTSTSSPATRNCGSNPPIAWRQALRNAMLQPGICSASRSERRTCVGLPGALATQSAIGPSPTGAILGPPIRTNLSKEEFVQRSTKTAAAGVGSRSGGDPISLQGHLYARCCCVRSVCVDPVADTGRSCTAAPVTLPLLLVSGQAVEDSLVLCVHGFPARCVACARLLLLPRTCASTQVASPSPTQRPLDRLTLEQLRRVRPFAARVHLAARTHASLNQCESRADAAMTSQCIHQQPGGVAHDLGQLDQAALRVVPGEEHDQPVLEQQSDQLRIQLTQHAPRVAGPPLVDASVRLPQFVEQLNGTITNDKFCLSRMGRLHLSWWRLPRSSHAPVKTETRYPSDVNEMHCCHQEGTHEETSMDHKESHH